MNDKPITQANDAFLRGSWAALQRAAERARRIAAQTGTAIVVFRDGKIEHVYPSVSSTASGVREGAPDYGKES